MNASIKKTEIEVVLLEQSYGEWSLETADPGIGAWPFLVAKDLETAQQVAKEIEAVIAKYSEKLTLPTNDFMNHDGINEEGRDWS